MSVLVLLAWSAAITVLVMVLVFGGRVERARHALRRIAGPPVWPVVGNAGSLTPLSVIHENVVSLHRKYGGTAVSLPVAVGDVCSSHGHRHVALLHACHQMCSRLSCRALSSSLCLCAILLSSSTSCR